MWPNKVYKFIMLLQKTNWQCWTVIQATTESRKPFKSSIFSDILSNTATHSKRDGKKGYLSALNKGITSFLCEVVAPPTATKRKAALVTAEHFYWEKPNLIFVLLYDKIATYSGCAPTARYVTKLKIGTIFHPTWIEGYDWCLLRKV